MRKTKMMNRLVAVLAAVMAAASMASISASAISTVPPADWRTMKPYEEIYDKETGIVGNREYWHQKQLRHLRTIYRWKYDFLDSIIHTTKTVNVDSCGFYHAKNVKLYGRKCLGIDDNGNWILGSWELLNLEESFHGGTETSFDIPGVYVSFAFSFDITWGTDFPYSEYDDEIRSIMERLLPLDPGIAVLPGHGPSSTIGRERTGNPFLEPFNEPEEEQEEELDPVVIHPI